MTHSMNPRALAIVIVGVAAVVEDVSRRQISNWTSGFALAAGLALHGAQSGWQGLLHSALGALIGFGVFLIFYLMGGMGGGDVKLMAGFGALLGDGRILLAALLAAIAGALFAVAYLALAAAARRLRTMFGWAGTQAPAVGTGGGGEGGGKCRESIPYAPAITVGAWLALLSEM
jgi:prepilin peptidase CpaA